MEADASHTELTKAYDEGKDHEAYSHPDMKQNNPVSRIDSIISFDASLMQADIYLPHAGEASEKSTGDLGRDAEGVIDRPELGDKKEERDGRDAEPNFDHELLVEEKTTIASPASPSTRMKSTGKTKTSDMKK